MPLRPVRFFIPVCFGLAALAIGCSSGASAPPPPAAPNHAPTPPVITGPDSAIQRHPVTYTLASSDEDGDAITFSSSTTGATISGTHLTFQAAAAGPQTLQVTAQDTKGGVSGPSSKTIQVAANGAPTFTSPASTVFTNVNSGNPPTYTYIPTATDPEADEVVFGLVAGSVEQAVDYPGTTGTFAGVADSIISVINPGATSANFAVSSQVPAGAIAKRTRLKVRAQDRLPGSAELLGAQTDLTVTMTVFGNNFPPVIQAFTPPQVRVNHPVTGAQLSATDPNSDVLTWSLVSVVPATAGIAITASGILSWNPVADTAARTVAVKVSDGRGGEDQKIFTWTPQPDTLPFFTPAPAYTETVGGVAMHEPLVQRAKILWRERFNYSDPLATDAEYLTNSASTLLSTGWRAFLKAVDAESDPIRFMIKPGSVYRFGAPYSATGSPNYPTIDAVSGEITWKPNGLPGGIGNPGGDAVSAAGDPPNWSFIVMAQQTLGGQPTPGFAAETTMNIRVLPNDVPTIGPLQEFIGASTPISGVSVGGGSGTGSPGRPSILGVQSSDTESPSAPAKFIWKVMGPGLPDSPGDDYGIWDTDSMATDGHQDALQIDLGTRAIAADGQVSGALSGLRSGTHFPAVDSTGNLPGVLPLESLNFSFYNPWIQGPYSPGVVTVGWAPVRTQYQLDRYLGGGQYGFPLIVEDQYAKASALEFRVGPIEGSVRFLNHRIRQRSDTLADAYVAKGLFTAAGNTVTGGNAYVFSYLPEGFSVAPQKQESATGILTYGSHLLGNAVAGQGAPASGYYYSLGDPSPTAGNWLTLDGSRNGADRLYPPNPLNETLHPAAHAAGMAASPASTTVSLVQWATPGDAGGTPVRRTLTVSGPYADGMAWARSVPSNAGYLFVVPSVARPWSGDGIITPRQLGMPDFSRRWIWGRAQSDVDVHAQVAGRPVLFPQLTVPAVNVDNLGTFFTHWATLRLTFFWPQTISQSAPGYPVVGSSNSFQETDLIQVATPNLSGNARFFVTGNTPGVNPPGFDKSPLNYFGKYGFTTAPSTYSGTGALRTTHPHQPIHAVTNSLWVPNNSDGRNQLPNAYTTPVGGGQYCDIPWVGIRGYLAPAAAEPLTQIFVDTTFRTDATQAVASQLAVAINPANPSLTGFPEDASANPALLDTPTSKDRIMFLWMKQASGGIANAYGAWAGSVVTEGTSPSVHGGATVLGQPLTMGPFVSNPFAEVLFAGSDNLATQPISTGTGMKAWRRAAFEGLADLMGAPSAPNRPARVRVADPSSDSAASGPGTTAAQFDSGAATYDGIPSNTLVVYALKDRSKTSESGVLGEAGIEPGSPILAQWWNTGHTDINETDFPGVIRGWSDTWLPPEFTEVIHLSHSFVGKVQFPDQGPSDLVAKVLLEAGAVLPKGHALLTDPAGRGPVITPVRQIQVADLKSNTASGNLAFGTRLDLFLGSAMEMVHGGPTGGAPSFKLEDGNGTGTDHRLSAFSTFMISFQPSAADPRPPSGYVVSLYRVTALGTSVPRTSLALLREVHMGHQGSAGAVQRLFLPSFSSMGQTIPGDSRAFVIKVRALWQEGDEGATGTSRDLGKAPFEKRFPMAYADALSGVFVVAY